MGFAENAREFLREERKSFPYGFRGIQQHN